MFPSHLPCALNPRSEENPQPCSLAKPPVKLLMQNVRSGGVGTGGPAQEACPAVPQGNGLMSQLQGFQLDLRKTFLTGLRDWQEFEKRSACFSIPCTDPSSAFC